MNHAGRVPRINLAGEVGAGVCNNVLHPKREFDAQSAGRTHFGGWGVAVLRPPSSVMSGHGGCVTRGGAGGDWAGCTQTRVNVCGCVQ